MFDERALADQFADALEALVRLMLSALPDDASRKLLVMALRARGALSDEATAVFFLEFPGMKGA